MENIKRILLTLITLAFLAGTGNAQINNTQSVTFYTKVNKGNISEVIQQMWCKKVRPVIAGRLYQELDNAFNRSVYVNFPDATINITATSLTVGLNNCTFGGNHYLGWPLGHAGADFRISIMATANLGVDSLNRLVVKNVNAWVPAGSVNIDIDGLIANMVYGFLFWSVDVEHTIEYLTNEYLNNTVEPGFENIVISNRLFETKFPGTDHTLSIAVQNFVDEGNFIKIPVTVTFNFSTRQSNGIDKNTSEELQPQDFSLSQNYPNPFNPTTTIKYALKEDVKVSLKIYNSLGQEVRTLVNENQTKGYKEIMWDGKNNKGSAVPSGVYIYRLVAGSSFVKSNKMVLVK